VVSETTERSIVVRESRASVNFLWGFLVVVAALVLWRGEFGDRTVSTRIAAGVIFVLLGVGGAAAWIWWQRHPGRLEVTPSTITLRHRGKPSPGTVFRKTGDLYLESHLVGSVRAPSRIWLLRVVGSEGSISLQFFKHREVEEASTAMGWTFAERTG
jgi:hypothetical protein